METFKVHILGCGSALPTPRHYSTSQIVDIRGKLFMIDCGEGTQVQMRRTHLNFNKLKAIFISHIHGDHCFGLMGLLSTFGLMGRTEPLSIYGPARLFDVLRLQIDVFCWPPDTGPSLGFEVRMVETDPSVQKVIYEDRSLTVESIPLEHRIPCCGFLFREKMLLPHIRRDMIDFYGIPLCEIANIKGGADWTAADGTLVPNERLVTPADKPRSYAFVSDTRYMPDLYGRLDRVDTLYHETTYGNDYEVLARKYFHSTARQAAQVARDAHVGKLLLGHYSSRYDDENVLLNEAREVFQNSFLTKELSVFDV